jgi:hypothetical protein
MTMTARQIVQQELIAWLERDELLALGGIKGLEDSTLIWEWGKWALLGEPKERIAGQLRFRGSRPESTHWDSIIEIPDDIGMQIDAAVSTLDDDQQFILRKVYEFWQTPHEVAEKLRISDERFQVRRREALKAVKKYLTQ